MKFGLIPVGMAIGAVLAHAVKQGGLVLKKGTVISEKDADRLAAAGVATVMAARLERGDVNENAAALRLGGAVCGAHVRQEAPFTGRCNLYAEVSGVLRVDAAAVNRVNAIDESITLATLPALRAVRAGEMVGTVKIIPFAVPSHLLDAAVREGQGALSVAPYVARSVAVISTLLPGLKPAVVDKTLAVLAERLAPAGARIASETRVAHEAGALAGALATAAADLIIVFGASAITDRADVIPAALEAAGGRIAHFGMPVDPGNLLMIGTLGAATVIGAPGCARSPRENGFDWVLQRLLAGIEVTRADIQALGVGGLLMEIVSRPQPRDVALPDAGRPVVVPPPRTAVLVLAAGRSTRMGGPNKLLALHQGKPLLRHTVEHGLAAETGPVTVVTGHQAGEIRAALAGLPVRFVHNEAFADGLSTSLQAGIASLPGEVGGVVVMLGDMPLVPARVIRRLAAVFGEHPGARAVVPTTLGERGNPVLIGRGLFEAVARLSGDIGARRLIEAAGADLVETAVDDPGIHRDFDTPEALARLWTEEM